MASNGVTYTRSGLIVMIAVTFVIGLVVGASLYGGLAGLQAWQTLIAASIALLAAFVAYANTSRQVAATTDAARKQRNEAALRRLTKYQLALQELLNAAVRAEHDAVAGGGSLTAAIASSGLNEAVEDELLGDDATYVGTLLNNAARSLAFAVKNQADTTTPMLDVLNYTISIGKALRAKREILLSGGTIEDVIRDRAINEIPDDT
jgi:hypothetical protein